jgi:hypothetical protein
VAGGKEVFDHDAAEVAGAAGDEDVGHGDSERWGLGMIMGTAGGNVQGGCVVKWLNGQVVKWDAGGVEVD